MPTTSRVSRAKSGSFRALAVARLTRASVAQKKWQTEYRAKAEAAADSVEKVARKGGLSDAAVQQIRREILGVVG